MQDARKGNPGLGGEETIHCILTSKQAKTRKVESSKAQTRTVLFIVYMFIKASDR